MKKAVIILLILLVVGIVGFFVYQEITVKEITYVSDVTNDNGEGRFSVKRLYSSDIDIEAFNKKVENLVMLEFSDEEIEAAALEAGTPQFYPAFYVMTYRPTIKDDIIYMDLTALQELAKGQNDAEYAMQNLKLEAMTTGVSIIEAEAVGTDNYNRTINETILKNESGTALMTELNDYGNAKLTLKGTTGTVLLQYTFDIKKNTIIPATALTDCMIMIRVSIITNDKGETEISYSVDPISSVDEYNEQE